MVPRDLVKLKQCLSVNKNGEFLDFYWPLYLTLLLVLLNMPQFLNGLLLEFNKLFRIFLFFREFLTLKKRIKKSVIWNFRQQVKFGRILEQY